MTTRGGAHEEAEATNAEVIEMFPGVKRPDDGTLVELPGQQALFMPLCVGCENRREMYEETAP